MLSVLWRSKVEIVGVDVLHNCVLKIHVGLIINRNHDGHGAGFIIETKVVC